jgi:hypothetical protein
MRFIARCFGTQSTPILCGLLCSNSNRPLHRRTTKKRNEFSPPHSSTSWASQERISHPSGKGMLRLCDLLLTTRSHCTAIERPSTKRSPQVCRKPTPFLH